MTTTDRGDLPLPDYDHLPIEVLRQRLRPLDKAQLRQVIEYESAHGDRLLIQQMLQHRLDELLSGTRPSEGPTGGPVPQTTRRCRGRGRAPVRPDGRLAPDQPAVAGRPHEPGPTTLDARRPPNSRRRNVHAETTADRQGHGCPSHLALQSPRADAASCRLRDGRCRGVTVHP